MSVALAFAIALFVGAPQTRNPREADPAAIQAGGALFRERCADCHGPDAKGVSGPDLTRLWTREDPGSPGSPGSTDERVFKTIRSGVPNSIMPPSSAPDAEIWAIVAYLRNISTAKREASSGNAANGERVFAASCATCHQINGRGGRLGPDLSRIAASQTNQVLTRAIRDASASFTATYEPVTIVTREGEQIRGTRKAEDVFSIQIMDTRQRLQGYLKANLRSVTRDKTSLMPDFGPDRLSDNDLNDLLAYLSTFRAAEPPRRAADRPVEPRYEDLPLCALDLFDGRAWLYCSSAAPSSPVRLQADATSTCGVRLQPDR